METVYSVLNQSFYDFELIVVNDGSSDDTLLLLNAVSDSRLKIISIPNSGGPAKPRNIGISNASGVYVSFVDADDTWYLNKLQFCYDILVNENIDVCYHQLLNTFNNNTLMTREINKTNSFEDLLLNGNAISLSGSIVSRDFILQNNLLFNESRRYKIVEDYDFWIQCASCGGNFFRLEVVLGNYNYNANSISYNLKEYYANLNWCIIENLNSRGFKIAKRVFLISGVNFFFLRNCLIDKRIPPLKATLFLFSPLNPIFMYHVIIRKIEKNIICKYWSC